MDKFLFLPGVSCDVISLQHPAARELAEAVQRRRWFRLVECRQHFPGQVPGPEETEDGTDDKTSPVCGIAICHSMAEAEAEAARLRQKSANNSAPESDGGESNTAALSSELDGVTAEFVVFEVEPEIPQYPVHSIHEVERLATMFLVRPNQSQQENIATVTFALREGFPLVPHVNPPIHGLPHSLCLWEESPAEVALFWTAMAHLERVQTWLRLTARGELHPPEQPLEPLFYDASSFLIVPQKLLDQNVEAEDEQSTSKSSRYRGRVVKEDAVYSFIVDDWETGQPQMPFVAIVLDGTPQTHGVIERAPNNVYELHQYGETVGLDVMGAIREKLVEWRENHHVWAARIVVVLNLPSRRTDDSEPEKTESYAFALAETVESLGSKWRLWTRNGNTLLRYIGQECVDGTQLPLLPLNVAPLLSRQAAALFNAQAPRSTEPKIVAVGAGAIGSQIFLNLARSGWGEWTVVDRDIYLPHNGARHILVGDALGYSKARVCCALADSLFDESFHATPLVADVLKPGDQTIPLQQAMDAAEVIFDFSASVPVARALSEKDAGGRRISTFLNPSGTDLILLAEDTKREVPLTALEMQLWRAVILDSRWHNYFNGENTAQRVRYARSCGDLSARIPQDYVALHAATASRALRQVLEHDQAAIQRWHLDPSTGSVVHFEWPVSSMREWTVGDWTVQANADTFEELWSLRSQRLPVETGGVLIGVFDRSRKIAHLVAALPAPSDSEECPASFLRGCAELRREVERVEKLTGGQVTYLGEWHSHPAKCGAAPSRKDFRLFGYLQEHRLADGLPPVMLILADKQECAWFVDHMPEPMGMDDDTPIVAIISIVQKED